MVKAIVFLLGICVSSFALAKTCPDAVRVVPGETGHWAASGWYSQSPVTSPQRYTLRFHQAQLISAHDDGSYRYVQCIYNDRYSNGLVTLIPVSNKASFPHLTPGRSQLWAVNNSGQMAHCDVSAQQCAFH